MCTKKAINFHGLTKGTHIEQCNIGLKNGINSIEGLSLFATRLIKDKNMLLMFTDLLGSM